MYILEELIDLGYNRKGWSMLTRSSDYDYILELLQLYQEKTEGLGKEFRIVEVYFSV